MNCFLFFLASLNESDVVYLNCELVKDPTKRSELYSNIGKIFSKTGNSYPLFCKKGKFYLLRGLFDAKDDKGRILPFLFASTEANYKSEVLNIAESIGYKISSSTIDAIQAYIKKRKIIMITSLSLLFLLMVVVLLIVVLL